jgi:hypothetical protein
MSDRDDADQWVGADSVDEESLSENDLEAVVGGGETPIIPPGAINDGGG